MSNRRSINLISYWHKVEHFSPYKIPKKKKGEERTYLSTKKKLPWINKINDTKYEYKYMVYFGIFKLEEATTTINNYFDETDKSIERDRSKTCLAVFQLDEEGKLVENSFKMPTLPWAVGYVLKDGLDKENWAHDFEVFHSSITDNAKDILYNCTLDKLEELYEIICSDLGWKPNKETSWIWIDERKTKKRMKNENGKQKEKDEDIEEETDILNSFYVKDLEKVLREIEKNNYGKGLEQFLNSHKIYYSNKRIDIENDKNQTKKVLSPRKMPLGRWPEEYSLSLMQQVAVNLSMEKLNDASGIFSVNGPPGTGKTTLLRDMIADIIVKRAVKFIKYSDPKDAFTEGETIEVNGYKYKINIPHKSLCKDSIVVASNNNGAVENISKELPEKKAIAKKYFELEESMYFRNVADSIIEQDCWGLLSVPLGNRKNCNEFADKFWLNSKDGKINMQQWFRINEKNRNVDKWKEIVISFNTLKSKVEYLIEQVCKWEKNILERDDVVKKISSIKDEIHKYRVKKDELKNRLVVLEQELKEGERKRKICYDNLFIINESKPWWMKIFFWLRKSKEYDAKIEKYRNELEYAIKDLNEKSTIEKETSDELKYINKCFEQKVEEYKIHEEHLSKIDENLINAKKILGDNFPDNKFWEQNDSELQIRCPWIYDKLNNMRAKLFLKALEVHKEFIRNSGTIMKKNLALFYNLMKGNICFEDNVKYSKDIWNSFFLLVPVISTTFASVARLFRYFPRESIGWLLIDEAGQAVPQTAVGAIWRSRRIIVVGDPLQIEPVVTIPDSILRKLGKRYNTKDYTSKKISVQTIADRINEYGTIRENNDRKIWVGCPLRVHRRCIEPMFSISNNIAYNDKMIYATVDKSRVNYPIGRSRWIDIKGKSETENWVPIQGETIYALIKDAFVGAYNRNKMKPDLFVISPFTSVRYGLQSMLRGRLRNDMHRLNNNITEEQLIEIEKWINEHIGTVHTFQGKQTDMVIMCLGVDKSKEGAARWASKEPNILNVAASRAKYRFIVVGDQEIWSEKNYFSYASKVLRIESKSNTLSN